MLGVVVLPLKKEQFMSPSIMGQVSSMALGDALIIHSFLHEPINLQSICSLASCLLRHRVVPIYIFESMLPECLHLPYVVVQRKSLSRVDHSFDILILLVIYSQYFIEILSYVTPWAYFYHGQVTLNSTDDITSLVAH